jgi:deoxyhypusine synthase
VIYIGGGITKSFIRQTEMSANIFHQQVHGHKYAIQFSADAPHPGGRSSAVSFDESIVYGKLGRSALTAYVNCDATIALPIIITALSQTAAKYMKGRRRPSFTFGAKDLVIDVP